MGNQYRFKIISVVGSSSYLFWAIWRHQNEIVFERKITTNFLQVLNLAIHWLCTWVVLQKPIFRELVWATCQYLEQVDREFFLSKHMSGDLVFRLITTSVWGVYCFA
jgi:hypothetical protein